MVCMRRDEDRASKTGRLSMAVDVLAGRRPSLVFKLSYLALAILSWNFLTANTSLLTVVSVALMAFGFVLLTARVLRFSRFRRTCGLVLLVLFCISYVVSSAAVARYGVLSNVQGFVWLSLQCFALFAYDASASPCDVRRDVEVFSGVFVAVTFVMALVGLVMAFVGYTYVGSIGYLGSSVGGMFGGRLFGLYSDVNLGAVCALVSALLSVAALCKGGLHRASVVFLVANIVVEFAYVGLSASRTAVVAGVVSSFLLCLLLSARHKPKVALDRDSKRDDSADAPASPSHRRGAALRRGAWHVACGAMGSILFLMLSFGSVFVYEKTSPWLFELLGGPVSSEDDLYEQALMQSDSIMPWDAREMIAEKNAADAVSDEGAGGTEEPAAAQDPDAASGVGETDASGQLDSPGESDSSGLASGGGYGIGGRDVSGDVSTGRIDIWKAAVEVWKTSPLIGVSHRNFAAYVNDVMPGTYFTQPWTGYTTMHNVFVDTLVAQGLVGLVILLAFVVVLTRRLVTGYRLMDGQSKVFGAALIACLLAIAVSALFYSEILYINTIGAVVFWSFAGWCCALGDGFRPRRGSCASCDTDPL